MIAAAWWLGVAAAAPMAHPCEPKAITTSDRYIRQSLVIFPVDTAAVGSTVAYKGKGPEGQSLKSDADLVASVAQGLFAVDYPLERFDAWLTAAPPVTDGDRLVPGGHPMPVQMALACTDAAVVPRIVSVEIEDQGGEGGASYAVKLHMELDVYQRRHHLLRKTQTLVARSPSVTDRVEDTMSAAREESVKQLKEAVPIDGDKIDKARDGADMLVSFLPSDQSAAAANAIEQFELGITRVASIARPATLVPSLDKPHPGPSGLGWRGIENACYTDPTEPEDKDHAKRKLECAVLNRTRQAVRSLQLSTRKVEAFRLFAPVHTPGVRAGTFPLGAEEGVRVGDGYWLSEAGLRNGYVRVKSVGPGGEAGTSEPSEVQVVFSRPGSADARKGKEDPRLNIEIGGIGGVLPIDVPSSELIGPDGVSLVGAIPAGGPTLAGTLTFDVNMGRMSRFFELYQTNRISRASLGSLAHSQAVFGLEKRFLVAPRTYVLGAGALGFQNYSVPTGDIEIDEEGNERELRASALAIGPEVGAGMMFMAHPAVMIRGQVGARVAKSITEFTYKKGETEITYVPDPIDGSSFELSGTGLTAGVAAAWIF